MPFGVKGIPEMAAKIRRASRVYPGIVGRAMYQEAQIEMTESKRIVPIDTGALRASGMVAQPIYSGTNITVILSYGMDYALAVHEDLSAFHPHGEAKYLEKPLKASAAYMAVRIARRINIEETMGLV